MTVNRQWHGQVKQVLDDLARVAKRRRESTETQAQQAFQLYEFNTQPPIVAEQTPQARAMREVARIANWYGFQDEVTRALDAWGLSTVAALDQEQIEQLVVHMRQLEDCRQNGGESPYAPAAR